MIKIIISGHGMFSRGLYDASTMIFGEQEHLSFVEFKPCESVDDLVENFREEVNGDEVLFLVDLFGGSPYNAACRIAVEHSHVDVISGVNLPMLLEVLAVRHNQSLNEVVELTKSNFSETISVFGDTLKNMNEVKDSGDDEL